MRFRPSSLLASTALLVLWGCPNFNVPSDTNGAVTINGTNINGTGGSAGSGSDTATTAVGGGNTTEHDDAVDEQTDVSWVQQVHAEAGASPVRFLMTDSPIDADNVFVTFCGIRVAPGVGTTKPADGAGTPPAPGAGGASGVGGANGGGAAGAPSAGGSAGDKAAAAAEEPAGIGAAAGANTGAGSAPSADAGPPPSDPSSATPWIIISEQCQTLDLLTLQGGITEAVGLGSLPPGAYGQIRLMVTEGSIVKNGLKQPLVVSSADAAEGFQVVGGFGVANGQPVTVTIDFDAGGSVEYDASQGFLLKPALRVIAVERAGAGDGSANGGSSTAGASGQPEPKPPQGTGGAAGSSGQQPPPPPPGTGGNAGSGNKPPPPPPGGAGGSAGQGGAAGHAA